MSIEYPIYYRGKATGNVFEFTPLHTAKCIITGPSNMTKAVGETYNDMKAHEDRTVWEPLTILQEAALKLNTKDTYEHN